MNICNDINKLRSFIIRKVTNQRLWSTRIKYSTSFYLLNGANSCKLGVFRARITNVCALPSSQQMSSNESSCFHGSHWVFIRTSLNHGTPGYKNGPAKPHYVSTDEKLRSVSEKNHLKNARCWFQRMISLWCFFNQVFYGKFSIDYDRSSLV